MEDLENLDDITSFSKYVVLIGNPGVGKSTLLNCLLGKPNFDSGFSAGRGMTQKYQIFKHKDGITYGDTPGLSDIKLRKQAAQEITKLFKLGGIFQIIFVVTVEAGRVRPDDVTTINLVLDSIDSKVPFGVIINKCSKNLVANLISNKNNTRENIVSAINSGNHKTESIYYFEVVEDMIDQPNVVIQLPDQLIEFIKTVPYVSIFKENLKQIVLDDFDDLKERLSDEINLFIKDAKKRELNIQESVDLLNKEREDLIIRQKNQLEKYKNQGLTLKQQMIEIEETYKKQIEEQKKKFLEKYEKTEEEQKKKIEEEKKKLLVEFEKKKKSLQNLLDFNQLKIDGIEYSSELNMGRKSTLESLLGFSGPIITTAITAGACIMF